MKKLWNYINRLQYDNSTKNRLFIVIFSVLCAVFGMVAWLLAGRQVFPGIIWFISFMCYPAMLVGVIGGTLYLYRHEF